MPQVLVRNLKAVVVERLKARARDRGRSLQSELKSILAREAESSMTLAEFQAAAARLRRKLAGRRHTDSASLQAEGRRR